MTSVQNEVLPDFVREHDIDPITLDIIENTLSNTRFEMDRVLETTAVSPVIREQSDQFPLIADKYGRMVIGQFGSAITTILEHSRTMTRSIGSFILPMPGRLRAGRMLA